MPSLEKPDTELVVPARMSAITPMSILEIAVSQGADIEKLTQLMGLQERWEANEARKAFNAAMAQFKKNPPRIEKNKHVKAGNKADSPQYWHATLDHVTDMITAALSAVGISHKWKVSQTEQIAVTCVLTHELGHSEETTLRAGADTSGSKNSIQAIGSTVTYLERYTLLAAVGMAPANDDDGQGSEADAGPHLEEGRLIECTEWIKAAEDSSKLAEAFTAACSVAKDAEDKSAPSVFVKAMLSKAIPWIKSSIDRRTLQIVFHRAYALAESVDDKDAMGQLRREADARKRELGGGA